MSPRDRSFVHSAPCRTALALLLLSASCAAQDVHVYFGNLHAHSNASDGNAGTSPADAYRIARDDGKLDFLSLSEHNHIMPDQATYDAVMAAANTATTGGFVALYGQEFSTIETGFNHSNIQNYPVRIPPELNGKYSTVFGTVLPAYVAAHPGAVVFAEFNHPEKIDNDYGFTANYGGDWSKFVADMDPFVKMIAVANGPSDYNNKGFAPSASERLAHQNISTARWFAYLSHGMHLAPKIDHDSHSPTYGFRHAGRTAVWARGNLSRDKLVAALAARHVYATEDRNLRIVPTLSGAHVAPQALPGDILRGQGDDDVSLSLAITDDDESGATYVIELWSGVGGSGAPATRVDDSIVSHTGNGSVTLTLAAENGMALYHIVHVFQTSPDPLRQQKPQDAWLAPVWIEPGPATPPDPGGDDAVTLGFVSSKKSDVYHHANCKGAAAIKPENLLHHDVAPPGKRLHQGCPWE